MIYYLKKNKNKSTKFLEIRNSKLEIPAFGEAGQALLTLLFFLVIAVTITTAAIIILISNSLAGQRVQETTDAYYIAESGAENGILRLLRNPNYKGETLVVGDGSATIKILNGITPTVLATGSAGTSLRTIQVNTVYNNNVLTIQSWKEVY